MWNELEGSESEFRPSEFKQSMSTSSAVYPVKSTRAARSQSWLSAAEQSVAAGLRPATRGINLIQWARRNVRFIDSALLQHGAVLFRGFGLAGSFGI